PVLGAQDYSKRPLDEASRLDPVAPLAVGDRHLCPGAAVVQAYSQPCNFELAQRLAVIVVARVEVGKVARPSFEPGPVCEEGSNYVRVYRKDRACSYVVEGARGAFDSLAVSWLNYCLHLLATTGEGA